MMTQTDRPLGVRQQGALSALVRQGSYPCGWCYGTHSETLRILDSLVKRGLATREECHRQTASGPIPYGYYRPTDAGREAAK